MFSFFKNRDDKSLHKEPLRIDYPPMPSVKPPAPDPSVVVSVGVTDDDRISLSVGTPPYNKTVFMNKSGANGLISLLAASIEMITEEEIIDKEIEDDEETITRT